MKITNRLLTFALIFSFLAPQAVRAEKNLMPEWYSLQLEAYSLEGKAKEEKLNQALVAARAFKQPDRYPESEILFTLGHWKNEQKDLAAAEDYLRQAAVLKEEGRKVRIVGKFQAPAGAGAGMVLPAYSTVDGEDSGKIHSLANCQRWLGRTLLAEGKNEEAAKVLYQSIVLCDQNPKPDAEIILLPDTLLPYAKALRALKLPDQAERAEERAKEIVKKRKLLLD